MDESMLKFFRSIAQRDRVKNVEDLAFVTTHLKLAEKAKVIYSESPKYSISALLSDITASQCFYQ